jgi:hypothetical protein
MTKRKIKAAAATGSASSALKPPKSSAMFIVRHERTIVFVLCILAVCRVFFFIAAFPFFNNVDETKHFDLVWKYSRGQLPLDELEYNSPEAAEFIALYATPEYLMKPEQYVDSPMAAPLWKHPNPKETVQFKRSMDILLKKKNHEMGQFPIYYMAAGLWCSLGRFVGIEGGNLLYWIRFLNLPIFALLVWFSFVLARTFFPDTFLMRIGLPLITAFFPQDIFYSINSNTFSPLLFAITFFLLLRLYGENKSYIYHLMTGLAVAATMLTNAANLPVLVFTGAIITLKVKGLVMSRQLKASLFRLLTLIAAALLPLSAWLARNYFVFGDLSGARNKVEYLGWTMKPLIKMWDHPIFTPDGLFYFLSSLAKTFWRGELVWNLMPIASNGMDLFYWISTALFIIVSCIGLFLHWTTTDQRRRFVLIMSLLLLVISVLFLAVLSMLYDFGNCFYPSRELPFFVSGRLISGALLPFLLLYLDGLERIFSRFSNRMIPLVVVLLIAIIITYSEVSITSQVLSSPFNWFHMP